MVSNSQLFGPSLYQGGRHSENIEVSNASALPEPTRLDTAGRPESAAGQADGGELGGPAGLERLGIETIGEVGMGIGDPVEGQDGFTYSSDELAVLAESFFQQRNGNIVGSVDEWWNTGNL